MATDADIDLSLESPGEPATVPTAMRETLKVLIPNGAVLGVVTLTQIELVLKISLLVASLIYTVLHSALLWKRLKEKKSQD